MRHWARHLSPSPIHILHPFFFCLLLSVAQSSLPFYFSTNVSNPCFYFNLSFCPASHIIPTFFFAPFLPALLTFGLYSFSSITTDQGATKWPGNAEDEGHIWLPARDSLVKELLCQSVGHISQQLQKPEVKQIESITQISRFFMVQVQQVWTS